MKLIWAVFLLVCPVLVPALRDNYCERNETVRSIVPVKKQRTVVKEPPKWKIWKKTVKFTETYDSEEEQVTHRLVRECCQGYTKVESGLCEPICTRGCPAHASCAAPERCECIAGYVSAKSHHGGSHYCEPICETGCTAGAQCVSPNTCACRDGYVQQKPAGDGVSGDCLPTCQVGGGCANGRCIDVERCACNPGYRWDKTEEMCQEVEGSSEELDSTEESLIEAESTSYTSSAIIECQEDFVLFNGECREKQFTSNEVSCLTAGCGPHQSCLESGMCQCLDGYVAQEPTEAEDSLTCQRDQTLLDKILGLNEAADDEGEVNPWTIPIIGVASGSLFVLLVVGLLGGRRYRMGRAKAADKELGCQYSQETVEGDHLVL
ncbi:anterior pharynx in excess protein 1 [Drosophila bipectinata]|uniref:anterior pharynx in excess protein 1 n=1 Tax=Drosophila bipectinata TaxID=42026 RepID=UPI0038B2D337